MPDSPPLSLAQLLPLLLAAAQRSQSEAKPLPNAAPGMPQGGNRPNAVPYMPSFPGANPTPASVASQLGALQSGGGGAGLGGLGSMMGGGGGSSSGLLSGLKSGKGGSSGMLSAAGAAALSDPAYADALTSSFGAVGL